LLLFCTFEHGAIASSNFRATEILDQAHVCGAFGTNMVPLVTTFMQITLFGKQPTLLKAKERLTTLHEVAELIDFEIDQTLPESKCCIIKL